MLILLQEKRDPLLVVLVEVVKTTKAINLDQEIITILAAQTLLHHLMGGVEMVEMDLLHHMVDQTMLVVEAVVPVAMALMVVVQEINMDLVEMVLNIR
jgi:hypothetical protein|tara:strand:- start:10 stop:303 length:294 start_codon:yes stop_codon:yes gene_type:complete